MKLLELEQHMKEVARQQADLDERKAGKLAARHARIVARHIRPLVVAGLLKNYDMLEADDLNAALHIQDEHWDDLQKKQKQGKQWFYSFTVILSLPEHDDIRVSDNRAYINIDEHKIEVKLETDRRYPWYVDDQRHELGDALDAAARAYQREQEVARDTRSVEQDAHNVQRARLQAKAKQLQDEERQAVCDILSHDPVAFRLLQAFIAIQDQRAAWEEQLEAASSSMADIEARYGERLSQAEQDSHDAQRKAENACYAASEAQDDADRVQRKLDQIERER